MNSVFRVLCAVAALVAVQAEAQLSSPLGTPGAPASGASPGAKGAASAPVPALTSPIAPGQGQGPGVHSPLSPFAPLKERADVVPWSVLTDVKTKLINRRLMPVYPMSVMALNRKTQRIQGFMLPLDAGEQQRHFLLASVPPTCPFCMPGGPESLVEVRTREPVKYSLNATVVEGDFRVLLDDPAGLYYRMTDAVAVK